MKKTLVLSFLSAILFADVADMQLLYDQNKYEQVTQEAKKSTSEYDDARLHLLWAKSAQALGRAEEAMGAYERVLMLTPDDQEARLQLAKLYANSDRMALTKQLSEDSEDYKLTTEERTTISALIIEDSELFTVSVNLGIGYDSNINVSPGDLDLPISSKEIGSRFVRFQATLSHTHYFESMEDVYMRSSAAMLYQSNEESYYNLFAGLVNTGIGYKGKSYDIFVPLEYSRMYYLEYDLMESIGVKPSMNYVFSSSLVGNINAKYTKRSYLQETDKKRDDSVLGVGMGLYWLLGDNMVYVKADYNEYHAKYSDPLPFVEKSAAGFVTGFIYQIDYKLKASGEYSYRHTSYNDTIPESEDERSDDYHKLGINLSRTITEDMEGSLAYSYTVNESNYYLAEYHKHVIMCNLNYKY